MKKFILVCSVFFVALGCKQGNLETHNSDKGYAVSYAPEAWTLEEMQDILLLYAINQPDPDFRPNINIYVQDLLEQSMSLEEYHQQTVEGLQQVLGANTLESEKSITVSGYPAKELIFMLPHDPDSGSPVDLKVKQIYAVKDSKAYLVTYTTKAKNFEVNLEAANTVFDNFSL